MKTITKINYASLTFLLLVSIQLSTAQETVFLTNDKTSTTAFENILKQSIVSQDIGKQSFVNIKFKEIPTRGQWEKLDVSCIQLLAYEGRYWYTALVNSDCSLEQLKALSIVEIAGINASHKQSISTDRNNTSENENETIQRFIQFLPMARKADREALLNQINAKLIMEIEKSNQLIIECPKNQLPTILAHPLVVRIAVVDLDVSTLNFESQLSQQIHPLKLGGLGLDGEEVVIGVGDNGQLGAHIDLNNRVQSAITTNSISDHAAHVCGSIAGVGNLDPMLEGIAPRATVMLAKNLEILPKTIDWHTDFKMMLTNNSYGPQYKCEKAGEMDAFSVMLDEQIYNHPSLLHIFAAGNSGLSSCAPYPNGYRTVLHSSASGKNVLTVGNLKLDGNLASNSSRGPAADGRTKPEVCAKGHKTLSLGTDYNYESKSGTSMATPVVTGILGLLYQRYRELKNGADPSSALMKALICNTADDKGLPGPDYSYGFGQVNARHAIRALEQEWYFDGDLAQGEEASFTIQVPANTSELKVLLYWHDRPNEALSAETLVNDLNLSLQAPNGEFLPWVLNPSPSAVDQVATRGEDHINNIEQITINQAQPGAYTIRVKGTEIPFGPQSFYLVYEFIQPELIIQYPYEAAQLIPGSKQWISWDKDLTTDGPLSLEYSVNDGQSWTTIGNLATAANRLYEWTVPNVFTEQARIRLTLSGDSPLTATSAAFSIIDTIQDFKVTWDCEGQSLLTWAAHDQATSYELYRLEDKEMKSYQVVDGLEVSLPDDENWWAIQAITASGKKSGRSRAQQLSHTPFVPLEADLNLEESVTCHGESTGVVNAVAKGGQGVYSYHWDNGEQGPIAIQLNAGLHSVTINDIGGCNIIAEVAVPEPSPLDADISTAPAAIYNPNGEVRVNPTGGTAPYAYDWSVDDSQSDHVLSNVPQGTYEVTITDANGCELIETAEVDFIDAIDDPEEERSELITVFPKPTNGPLNIDLQLSQSTAVSFALYNSSGQQVRTYEAGRLMEIKQQWDLSSYPPGMYILDIRLGERNYQEKVLLIR